MTEHKKLNCDGEFVWDSHDMLRCSSCCVTIGDLTSAEQDAWRAVYASRLIMNHPVEVHELAQVADQKMRVARVAMGIESPDLLNIGDVVELKSGGARMVIDSLSRHRGYARLLWHDTAGALQQASIATGALRKVTR